MAVYYDPLPGTWLKQIRMEDANASMEDVRGLNSKEAGAKLDFLVGISPQYWAYVPLSIVDVLELKLKDGIHWMPSPPANSDGMCCPVSKCRLMGYVVHAMPRKDGSMAYVVDDGTGLIDCVHWSASIDEDSVFRLPSLTRDDEYGDCQPISVGEPVMVFGKIESLASTNSKATSNGDCSHDRIVIREIQAFLIERVEDYIVSESHHWIKATSDQAVSTTIASCLESLGPQVRSQINNRVNLPAVDDSASSWRVFGMTCNCRLEYMDELLYCHCQSKAESMDPLFRFRDALLERLVEKQSNLRERLKFTYKDVKNDPMLRSLAWKEMVVESSVKKDGMVEELFLRTFRALRHDGIFYLLDNYTDQYLLITKCKVLEPFVRQQMSQETISSRSNFIRYDQAPAYISRVQNERLLYIKRQLLQTTSETKATPSSVNTNKQLPSHGA